MELLAPAKINISFQILGRREDGFHEIDTVMAPISLCDKITIARGKGIGQVHFRCDDPTLPAGDDNLAVSAANLFLQFIRSDASVMISLAKRIPHGAGLGGGSSDAATVLMGLNEVLETKLNLQQLIELASEIGSDVPFFILRSAARCQGRGERVSPVNLPRKLRLLLIKPKFGVPTPWVYSRWGNSRELPRIDYESQEFQGMRFSNDLERPVFEKFPFLAHLKMWLRQQPEIGAALLSGSGSTVFAVLLEQSDATKLAERVRGELDPTLWTCACETIRPLE